MAIQRTLRVPVLFFAVLIAFGVVGFSSAGEAHSINAYRSHVSGALDIRFDYIEVTHFNHRVVVDYSINPVDWSRIERARIRPFLEIYTPSQGFFRRDKMQGKQSLINRRGTVVFYGTEIARSRRSNVLVALDGHRAGTYIRSIRYGRKAGQNISMMSTRVISSNSGSHRLASHSVNRTSPHSERPRATVSTTRTTTTTRMGSQSHRSDNSRRSKRFRERF